MRLPFDDESLPAPTPPSGPTLPPDEASRRAAVDPRRNVVLEASAGTGKTRVLVDRYVNLLAAGVAPANILAMTFTRKAAAEMRERIVARLRGDAVLSPEAAARWRELRDRLNEIAISTIDAFCLALLREFPLEADLDPGFDLADETAAPRLIDEALDRAMRICRAKALEDESVALLFAQLGERRLRLGLAALLDRRAVAVDVLRRVLSSGPRDLTVAQACDRGADRLAGALAGVPGGLDTFLDGGPVGHPFFDRLAADIRTLVASAAPGAAPVRPAWLRGLMDRLAAYFLTKAQTPRKQAPREYKAWHPDRMRARRHWDTVMTTGGALVEALRGFKRDLNVVLSRAVWIVFGIATAEYRRTLERHNLLDFGELLSRARALLGNMDEFARSRYLLEARYHHVLVDEFQDTSRAQWELVSQLIAAWGEGFGPAHGAIPPSIFIVGDRKQSIYGFRDADVALMDEAAGLIARLREDGEARRAITHSFRSAPAILAFVNDVFEEVEKAPERPDAFRYDERDRFPADHDAAGAAEALGVVAGTSADGCAEAVGAEIARLLAGSLVRDRTTGVRRPAEPGDIAILFRTRETHRVYERVLERRGIPAYVYKGLGFFDADEIKDITALVRYLADPWSDLRAAALLRSRFVRLSDVALQRLAPGLARALAATDPPALDGLDDEDRRVLAHTREAVSGWLRLCDAVPPAELIDQVLRDTAYAFEYRGPRAPQARENVKKIRSLVRRLQNRGYLTMGRLSEHLERLSAGDESNAVVDALNAVNLMTVHAAKGLEFPIVFLVSLEQPAGGMPDPIRVSMDAESDEAVAVGDFHTDFDDDAGNRDAEETKRLLYVALTRARDRLYLAATLKDGVFAPGRGGLGAVCPPGVRALFRAAAAAEDGGQVEWRGPSGAVHVLRSCARPGPEPADLPAAASVAGPPGPVAEDFGRVEPGSAVTRVPVTAVVADGEAAGSARGARSDRLLAGRLVHRLFQYAHGAEPVGGTLEARAGGLVRDEERAAAANVDAVIQAAARMYTELRARDDVRQILDGATCAYEVPFTLDVTDRPGSRLLVRGVMDCLARSATGAITVIDFKTGEPRQSDRDQMAVYVEAARLISGGQPVSGCLIYAGQDPERAALEDSAG